MRKVNNCWSFVLSLHISICKVFKEKFPISHIDREIHTQRSLFLKIIICCMLLMLESAHQQRSGVVGRKHRLQKVSAQPVEGRRLGCVLHVKYVIKEFFIFSF